MACWADDILLKDFLEIKVIKITYYSAASSRLRFLNHHSNCGGAGVGPRHENEQWQMREYSAGLKGT